MHICIRRILRYVIFFLVLLGLLFLLQELWNWFQGDSLLLNAITITIAIILLDLCRLLFNKFTQKKN
jgi:hypothetical protein